MGEGKFINKLNIPSDKLSHALSSLSQNGDEGWLLLFIKNNGIAKEPYNLNPFDKKTVRHLVEGGMERIEKDLDYNRALNQWKLLVDAGLLTPEIMMQGIKNYMSVYMLRSKEAIDAVYKNTDCKLTYYPPDFINEFKKDLSEKIKNIIGFNINL
jgi:hypothetical protein